MFKPYIGITIGDPSGIGPEITVKALSDRRIYEICRPVVIGDKRIISSVIEKFGERIFINEISDPSEALSKKGTIDLISLSSLDWKPASPSLEHAKAMVLYIEKAVELAVKKRISAIVTCPISKRLMHQAGYSFDGHTPFIAHLTGTKDYVMMLAGERLKVSLVTIHCALRDVPRLITEKSVYKTIIITAEAMKKDFGIEEPRIAVAALNPHAGEGGLFGDEEAVISKAIKKAEKRLNMKIYGPLPPDTLYFRAAKGEFDVVVSMYHDQGLIPLKLLHFSDAVNITLGLPIVRTSVDHGTAYDIAGKGIADPESLKSAIRMAVLISKRRYDKDKGSKGE